MITLDTMPIEDYAKMLLDAHRYGIRVGDANCSIGKRWAIEQYPELESLLGHFSVNGLEVFGFLASGKTEHPVYLVVWEGSDGFLKGGVPDAGNMYNRTTLAAYGNDPNCFDAADEIGRDGLPEFEPKLLRKSIEEMVK